MQIQKMKISSFFLIGFLCLTQTLFGQGIPYGNNPETGKYFTVEKVKLYYEVYGEGEPLLLLHGGLFGYIDEFTPFIDKLAKDYQVICLATRGHGKSEIGNEAYTYKQRAGDAHALLKHLQIPKAMVLGFSDGGYSALKMAALYPESVVKVIAIGIGDIPKDEEREPTNYSKESLFAQYKSFFEGRLALMPQPDRWEESLQYLNHLYNKDYLSKETLGKISCPALLINGEKDEYTTVDKFTQAYTYIPNAQMALIPGCGHVVFYCKFDAVWAKLVEFL